MLKPPWGRHAAQTLLVVLNAATFFSFSMIAMIEASFLLSLDRYAFLAYCHFERVSANLIVRTILLGNKQFLA